MMASFLNVGFFNFTFVLYIVLICKTEIYSTESIDCTSPDCGSPTESRCFRQRELAKQSDQFAPDCTSDGYYKPVQCHSGYCWCSTIEGRPLSGTAVKLPSLPHCQQSRTNRRRESKPFKRKRFCSQSDRAAFNANLVDIFRSELKRISNDTSDSARVVAWKFSRLDVNGDSRLGKKELRFLRRMLVKVVEPKHCARLFFSYCDSDSNGAVERQEWQVCLGVSGSDLSLRLFMSLAKGHTQGSQSESAPLFPLKPSSNEKDDDEDEEQNEKRDCASVREAALKEDGSFGVFVPTCDQRGNFEEVQCLKSLCWCVWTRSGKPIRGSVTKDGYNTKPDCENAKKNAKAYKGCSVKRKSKFIENLLIKLVEDYKNETRRNYVIEGDEIKWKFYKLDTNKNGLLEGSEWKQWKREIRNVTNSKLRKCGRNFLRFCDRDSNKSLTISEFQECLQIQKKYSISSSPFTRPQFSSVPKRKNPFVSILKSD